MMVFNKNMLGGMIGAIALNAIHQVAKRIDPEAPEIDKIGEQALSKTIRATGNEPPHGNNLFLATLGSDIAANAMYFSLTGIGGKKNMLLRGAVLGAAAGIGTLQLTKPLGLDDAPVKKSMRTQVMTVSWYLLAGLITAGVLKAIKK
jgi:hypothetical protein